VCHFVNSVKNPELSFHKFPQDSSLKETWLNLLHIDKLPLKSHKICSLHFPGGKKSFGALPTVLKLSCRQTVNSSQGREHILSCDSIINNSEETTTSEQQTSDNIKPDIKTHESSYEKLTTEHAELKTKYDELSSKYEQCVLRIEHVLAK
jgi:hypothetical protein